MIFKFLRLSGIQSKLIIFSLRYLSFRLRQGTLTSCFLPGGRGGRGFAALRPEGRAFVHERFCYFMTFHYNRRLTTQVGVYLLL